MGKASESIWSNEYRIIPMAEVSHIEKYPDTNLSKDRILIIFKHSRVNNENAGDPEPNVYLDSQTGSNSFVKDWCYYRSEIESETLIQIQ